MPHAAAPNPSDAPVPTVFVVDDDAAILKSLSRLLRAAHLGVATFQTPEDFLARHDPEAPGCIVLDVAMPRLNVMDLQQALKASGSSMPIVFLTGHGDITMGVQAMKRGAVDFLTKPVQATALLTAIQAALDQDRAARQHRAEMADIQGRVDTLTPREREVLDHVVAGQLNKQTADALGTAEKTIKVHRARVMEKMKVQSLAELVRLAERLRAWGAVSSDPPPV